MFIPKNVNRSSQDSSYPDDHFQTRNINCITIIIAMEGIEKIKNKNKTEQNDNKTV